MTTTVLVLNMVLIAGVYIPGQRDDTFMVKEQLYIIREKSIQQPVTAAFSVFTMNQVRFDEWGIRYREVADMSDCPHPTQISFSFTKVCINPEDGY